MLLRHCCTRQTSLARFFTPRSRNLWSTRSVISDKPEELLESLPSLRQTSQISGASLFTLSRNIPPPVLSKLVQHFQSLPSNPIGCLSWGPEDGTAPYSLSYAFHQSPPGALELVVPFRSTISGTPKISLGREVQARLEKDIDTSDWAGDKAVAPEDLPEELRGLDPASVASIVFFSDEQPQGLMKTLDHHLPNAQKLGLLASSTPFFTGRPHTILNGQEIHSSGAAGVAICRRPAEPSTPLYLDYNGLKPLGGPLEVTVARGNIIMELGHTNATKLLLERIQHGVGAVIDKEKGFYLGILPEGKTSAELSELESVRPIIAGDPSRGALSLDTEASILPGRFVQFYHLPDSPASAPLPARSDKLSAHSGQSSAPSFAQAAASDSFEILSASSMSRQHSTSDVEAGSSSSPPSFMSSLQGQGALAFSCEAANQGDLLLQAGLADSFTGCSEHGYVVGRPNESSWICSVKGSTGLLRL